MPSKLLCSLFSFNLYYIPVYMYYPIIEKSFVPDTNWIFHFNSVDQSCVTLCKPMDCSMPGLPAHHQFLGFTQTHVHWVSEAIQTFHPLLPLLVLPSIFPSIMVFSNESTFHMRWPKYWSFSFNISPSNQDSGLICFRMDWFNLPAVQGTLKILLQHQSSKASILRRSAFLFFF